MYTFLHETRIPNTNCHWAGMAHLEYSDSVLHNNTVCTDNDKYDHY